MIKIESKPYKLIGKLQYYDWGTKNEEAFIPKLLGIQTQPDLPYAEYWIGVHPKVPSELLIDNDKISLIELLKEFPLEILGERVAVKFNNTLPFLLKVLSINQALSIQAHPDKALAKVLHQKDPKNYPDENHKPEIAIAIDNLKAIVGLRTFEEIKKILEENSEIEKLVSLEIISKIKAFEVNDNHKLIKQFYSELMNAPKDKLEKCIAELKNKFESKKTLTEIEDQFLIEFKNYGNDIGLISLLLFNMINLKSGEAIFTSAGIPHAYLKGNILECMANSDNVVRAGLTPKFKDINTLTEMLIVDSSKSMVNLIENENSAIYKTSAEEFEVQKLLLKDDLHIVNNDEINIIIIIEGKISIKYDTAESQYSQGDSVLIPAVLNDFVIVENKSSLLYQVKVPF